MLGDSEILRRIEEWFYDPDSEINYISKRDRFYGHKEENIYDE